MNHHESNLNKNNKSIVSKRAERKQAKLFAMQKRVSVFALFVLLVVGLVSTTFASINLQKSIDSGSLMFDVQNVAVSQNNKDFADTSANVDIAETSATITSDGTARLYFNMNAVSWWNTASAGGGNYGYFFNNSTGKNAWSTKAVQYSGNTYYIVIPAGEWEALNLTRNSVTSNPSWDNDWNQTGNITLSSSSNYLSSFSEGSTSVTWGTAVQPESTASLTASASTVNTGENVTLTPSLSSNADINTIKSTSYSISPSTGASITDNTFTATAAGTYTVTATVTYNPNGYSSITSTATTTTSITVASSGPSISADPTSVALEYGTGSTNTSKVVNLTTSGATSGSISVSSANTSVASVSLSGNALTITATGIGETTITAQFHDATVEIPVKVTKYNPYYYIYCTDSVGLNGMYLHYNNGNNKVQMVNIGTNELNQSVYAIKILKSDVTSNIIKFGRSTSNSSYISAQGTLGNADQQYYYISSNGWVPTAFNGNIIFPTVTLPEVTISIAQTTSVTASVENAGTYDWSIDNSDVATISESTTNIATVTGEKSGKAELTVRVYAKEPTDWTWIKNDDSNEYISTVATATVTVENVYYTINTSASYSNDGTTYINGAIGGTVSATYGTQSGASISVPYNDNYTLTATSASGYEFNGWTKNGVAIEGDSPLTVSAKENANYVAKFIKTYEVTVDTPTGIASVKINNSPGTLLTVRAGDSITVYASPSEGYRFDKWTVVGTATAADTDKVTATISNIQSNITVTPVTVKIYKVTYDQYVNRVNTDVGTVTVNGSATNNQTFDAGTEVTLIATSDTRKFLGWYDSTDTNFTNPLSTNATYVIDSLNSDISVVAMFYRPFTIEGNVPGSQVELTYDIATNTYTGTSNAYKGNTFTVKDTFGNTPSAAEVAVTTGTHVGATVSTSPSGYTLNVNTAEYDTTKPISYKMVSNGTGVYKLNITLTEKDKYSVTVVETGGKGTVKLNGTQQTTLSSIHSGKSVSVEITPPKNYVIKSISGGVTSDKTDFYSDSFVISGNTTINVEYEAATRPKVTITIDDKNSETTEGGELSIDGNEVSFSVPTIIDYKVDTPIVITPPTGYYAVIEGYSYDNSNGTVSFNVNTPVDVEYTVKFMQPKISVVQPKYGSIYVTSGTDDDITYYFNDDPVPFDTQLTAHIIKDNDSCTISSVSVDNANNLSFDNTTGITTFNIVGDAIVSAEISIINSDAFTTTTEYGTRRVFFTDNYIDSSTGAVGWGEGRVAYHTSIKSNDTAFTSPASLMNIVNNYQNEYKQNVFYVDVPFGAKYITFYDANDPNVRYEAAINNNSNAFYIDNDSNSVGTWQMAYSDYRTVDPVEANGEKNQQQAKTTLNTPVTFAYTCNFGDETLSATVVDGNSAKCTFSNGKLTITPTETERADYSLIKVTSSSSTSVKYYLIKVESFSGSIANIQKIYNLVDLISLKNVFKDYTSPLEFTYHISSDNVIFGALTDMNQKSAVEIDSPRTYEVSYDITTTDMNGVKYLKIIAKDAKGRQTVVSEKTVFGTDAKVGNRYIYLKNSTVTDISKYSVRACFESANYDKFWVTMQPVSVDNDGNAQGSDGSYYRAMIPDDYSHRVSFYLTDKNSYSNYKYSELINSTDTNKKSIADTHFFYYRENITLLTDIINPTFSISSLNYSKVMDVELLQ